MDKQKIKNEIQEAWNEPHPRREPIGIDLENASEVRDWYLDNERDTFGMFLDRAADRIDSLYSTPSPVAPEVKIDNPWGEDKITERGYSLTFFKSGRFVHPLEVSNLENAFDDGVSKCAAAYKAHYDPIVEGLKLDILNDERFIEQLKAENAQKDKHITDLAEQVISLESQLAQKNIVELDEKQTLPSLEEYRMYLQELAKQTAPYPLQYAQNEETAITLMANLMLKAGFRKVKSLAPEKEKGK